MLSVWAMSLRRSSMSCYAARKSSALAYLSDKPIESISARTRASMHLSYPSMLAISRSICAAASSGAGDQLEARTPSSSFARINVIVLPPASPLMPLYR